MKKSVLVYSRPAWHKWWLSVALQAFQGFNLVELSEYKNTLGICLMERFYNIWGTMPDNIDNPEIPVEDVRLRCRLLNSLPKSLSLRMIACAWKAVNDILDEVEPQCVLSLTVDSYIIDLLARACKSRSIQFIGISNYPITGYSLVSERGEHNRVREPSEDEIQRVLEDLLQDNFKPKYMFGTKSYSIKNHVKRVMYYRLKEVLFRLKRVNDPLNYNLMVLPFAADKKNFFGYRAVKFFDTDPIRKWNAPKLPKVYIPLHFVPEATVNYWTDNINFIKYEETLLEVVNSMSQRYSIAAKEHPAAMGTRNNQFYEKLIKTKNLTLVHSDYPSLDLINQCDVVLTWTGTVGLESALRGKKVVLMGDPYYYLDSCFTKIHDVGDLQKYNISDFKESDQIHNRILVEHVLSGSLRGTFGQQGYLSDDNAVILANSIKLNCYEP